MLIIPYIHSSSENTVWPSNDVPAEIVRKNRLNNWQIQPNFSFFSFFQYFSCISYLAKFTGNPPAGVLRGLRTISARTSLLSHMVMILQFPEKLNCFLLSKQKQTNKMLLKKWISSILPEHLEAH
jgi:hypothetical protein